MKKLILASFLVLAACFSNNPHPPGFPAGLVSTDIAYELAEPVDPDKEIDGNYYENLGYMVKHPTLKVAIRRAFEDGKVTVIEYNEIVALNYKLVDAFFAEQDQKKKQATKEEAFS